MTDYKNRTMIVPAAYQQLAQELCAAAAEGDAGKGMFTTPLSQTGSEPASFYISAGEIDQKFADILPLTIVTEVTEENTVPQVTVQPGNTAVVESIAANNGLTLPSGTIEALFGAIDVSEQNPFVAMARLGVKLVESSGDTQ